MNRNEKEEKDILNDMLPDMDEITNLNPSDEPESEDQSADQVMSETEGAIDLMQKVQDELGQMKDKFLRLNAEFDNYKRRTLKERMELFKTANADLMIVLLPVLDDFERAIKALDKDKANAAVEGVTLIYNKLKTLLEQKGLKAMESKGEVFNVDLHEAITAMPSSDSKLKGRVMEEIERGYYLNDKVIRHAKVIVYS